MQKKFQPFVRTFLKFYQFKFNFSAESNMKTESLEFLLARDVQKMFENEMFPNLNLICKNGEILNCHKFILFARSLFAYAILSNKMEKVPQEFE